MISPTAGPWRSHARRSRSRTGTATAERASPIIALWSGETSSRPAHPRANAGLRDPRCGRRSIAARRSGSQSSVASTLNPGRLPRPGHSHEQPWSFSMEVEARAEVDGHRQAGREIRDRLGEQDLPAQGRYWQIDPNHGSDRGGPGSSRADHGRGLDDSPTCPHCLDFPSPSVDALDLASDGNPGAERPGRGGVALDDRLWSYVTVLRGEGRGKQPVGLDERGLSDFASDGVSTRLGTPYSRWMAILAVNASTSCALSRRNRYPTWCRSISHPGRRPKSLNACRLRCAISILRASENWARTPPAARLVDPHASWPRSTSSAFSTPASAR